MLPGTLRAVADEKYPEHLVPLKHDCQRALGVGREARGRVRRMRGDRLAPTL